MITFYWCPQTRAARTYWLLEELGVEYRLHPVDLHDPESRADPAFRSASPMGKVPAIADGDVRVADSAAIALYLADRYAKAGLAPAIDDPDRGRYLFWSTFAPGVIEPAMMERFNGWEVNPGTSGWGNFDRMIRTFEQGLETGPWILGERFSAADTLLGSSAYFMQAFGILPESASLEAYIERCLARPAYAAALAANQQAVGSGE